MRLFVFIMQNRDRERSLYERVTVSGRGIQKPRWKSVHTRIKSSRSRIIFKNASPGVLQLLSFDQLRILSAKLHQLFVSPGFCQMLVFDNCDSIGISDRAQPVGDDD